MKIFIYIIFIVFSLSAFGQPGEGSLFIRFFNQDSTFTFDNKKANQEVKIFLKAKNRELNKMAGTSWGHESNSDTLFGWLDIGDFPIEKIKIHHQDKMMTINFHNSPRHNPNTLQLDSVFFFSDSTLNLDYSKIDYSRNVITPSEIIYNLGDSAKSNNRFNLPISDLIFEDSLRSLSSIDGKNLITQEVVRFDSAKLPFCIDTWNRFRTDSLSGECFCLKDVYNLTHFYNNGKLIEKRTYSDSTLKYLRHVEYFSNNVKWTQISYNEKGRKVMKSRIYGAERITTVTKNRVWFLFWKTSRRTINIFP